MEMNPLCSSQVGVAVYSRGVANWGVRKSVLVRLNASLNANNPSGGRGNRCGQVECE